eukprot:3437107-Rhodomonas_salina.1
MACSFQGIHSRSFELLSSTLAACIAPARELGMASLHIQRDKLTLSSIDFEYTPRPTVLFVHPSFGYVGSSEILQIVGSHFYETSVACMLNTSYSFQGQVVTSSLLLCSLPAQHEGGIRSLSVEAEGSDYFSQSVQLPIVQQMRLLSLEPFRQTYRARQLITVRGTDFIESSLFCLFGREMRTKALWIADGQVACRLPEIQRSSNVSFGLTGDGLRAAYWPSYLGIETATEVTELFPSSPPRAGVVSITILGSGFASEEYVCSFGGHNTVAIVLSSSELSCAAPTKADGLVQVEVFADSGVKLESRTKLFFRARDPLALTNVFPTLGSVLGGTLVSFRLEGHVKEDAMHCTFGSHEAVRAVVTQDSNRFVCTSPANSPGKVSLSITSAAIGSRTYESNFLFVANIKLESVHPSTASSTLPSPVTVSGQNFVDTDYLACQFGRFRVRGLWLSSSRVVCKPPAARGILSVTVSNNGADFDCEALTLVYSDTPRLDQISPSIASEHGGMTATIIGTNFVRSDAAVCRVHNEVIPARVLTVSLVQTTLPSSPPGIHAIEFSNDGVTFFPSEVYVRFVRSARVLSVKPSLGVLTSGTLLTVTGADFPDAEARCLFMSNSP